MKMIALEKHIIDKKLFLFTLIISSFFSCKKDSSSLVEELPSVVTIAASNISSTSITSGGEITNNDNVTIISSGICYANTPNPSLFNFYTSNNAINGLFESNLINLNPSTTYYIRAYLRTINDTIYGNQVIATTPNQHIYICGAEKSTNKWVAKFWKNGVATSLTNGTRDAKTHSVFVNGNDVYIAGFENNGTKNVAKIWKNGVATNLTTGTNDAEATSVVVTNNTVYVAGFENNGAKDVAKLWVNGAPTNISNGVYNSKVFSVAVSNNNIYVCGYEEDGPQGIRAKLWTNGVPSILNNGNYFSNAYSVFLNGLDVYVAGFEAPSFANNYVMLWKNGVKMQIDQGDFFFGYGKSVFVYGGDVHLIGTTNDKGASWWKNGKATALTNSYQSVANAVQIAGGNVHVVGYTSNALGYDIAAYWANGVLTSLSPSGVFSSATSIFVQ